MSLGCGETYVGERVIRARKDPVLLHDDRILQNLLELEERYLVSTSYFECVQRDVQPYMRKIVATWMMQVCDEQQCEEDVFPLSMNYLDRFLCIHPIHRTKLQSLGSACMLVASKVKETSPLTTEKLVMYTEYSVQSKDLLDFEMLLLMKLKWDVLSVTPIDFVDHIIYQLDLDNETCALARKDATTFIHLCCTDHKFSVYTPSLIASGSVGAAVIGLPSNKDKGCRFRQRVLHKLQQITQIDPDMLLECLEQVDSTLKSNLLHIGSVPSKDAHPAADPQHYAARPEDSTPTDVDMVF